LAEEHLRFLEISGVKACGVPAIHLRQALVLPQPTEAQYSVVASETFLHLLAFYLLYVLLYVSIREGTEHGHRLRLE